MEPFSWSNFDADFLKNVIYSKKTDEDLKPEAVLDDVDLLSAYMQGIAVVPDRDFVMKYRTEIEFHLFKKYQDLVLEISGANKNANYLSELNKLTQKKLSNGLIAKYIKAIYKIGGYKYWAEHYSEYNCVRTADLTSVQESYTISLFDYQKDAVKKLKEHFIEKDGTSGLLVMPTGSGKTRTCVAFLLQHMLAEEGYQVIWLTHRHMLIDQTADTFFKNCATINSFNPEKKKFKMVCVSGQHQTIKATEKDDDLMILSVQSTCRNLEYLKTVLQRKVIIVVDEAHHTTAKSYQKIIGFIRKKRKNVKLLGLTATPVRGTDNESRYLQGLFENHIVYDVPMSQLIKDKYLATPKYEKIETGKNFEAIVSLNEEKYIKRWGELPESLVDKVAKSSERNHLIVEKYLDNKERYGKTIIFALNVYHAYTLTEEMRKHNVQCDFVYSRRGKEENQEVINKFKAGKIEVLININILSEGSDIPDIQTVFLTRPTTSEVLLMQMIGRGMRGISARGTEHVYIVDFVDQWDTFNKWLNPELLLNQGEVESTESREETRKKPRLIPWGMVHDIYNSLSLQGGKLKANIATPYGWYTLVDEEGEDYNLIVFEDQYPRYQLMYQERNAWKNSGKASAAALRKLFFRGFVLPPTDYDLKLFWNNICDKECDVTFFLFEDRDKYDHFTVARKVQDEKLDLLEYSTEIYNQYAIVQELYGSVENYRQRIFDTLNWNETSKYCTVEELPIILAPFVIDEPHDLNKLTQDVINEMFEGKNSDFVVHWTDKPYKTYYGRFFPGAEQDYIEINCLLNSSQVPEEVIKYVIYHELLHRTIRNHGPEFRSEEHKYPNYTEWERFLDFTISNEYKLEM